MLRLQLKKIKNNHVVATCTVLILCSLFALAYLLVVRGGEFPLFISVLFAIYLFLAPGYAINALLLSGDKYYQGVLQKTGRILIDVFVSVAVLSFTGLLLADIGIFSIELLLSSQLVLCTLLLSAKLLIRGGSTVEKTRDHHSRKEVIAILALAIFAILTLFHSYEMISGGHDQGVYVVTGVSIAKNGSTTIHSDLISQMDDDLKDRFYEPGEEVGAATVGFQYPGFFITDIEKGTISPQFFHLYPVWIAIFYSLFGLKGAFLVNPIFGVLSVLSVYLFCKIAIDYRVGIIAGVFLALNYSQIWYANYTTSEMMAQFFIFSGLSMLAYFSKNNKNYIGILSAALLGCALLTRVDAYLIIPALAVFIAYYLLSRKGKKIIGFSTVFLGMFAFSLLHGLIKARPYFSGAFEIFTDIFGKLGAIGITSKAGANNVINNMEVLSNYVSPILIVLGIYGLILLLIKKRGRIEIWVFGIIFITFTFIYIRNPMLNVAGGHPWWVRRFVPVTIPALYILAAFLVVVLMDKIRVLERRRDRRYLMCALGIFLLAVASFHFFESKVLLNHDEGKGTIEAYEELSSCFEEDDIIITYHYYITSPLSYIYDKNVIFLVPFNEFSFYKMAGKTLIEEKLIGLRDILDELGPGDVYLVVGDTKPVQVVMDMLEEIGYVDFEYPKLRWSIEEVPPQETFDSLQRYRIYKFKKPVNPV